MYEAVSQGVEPRSPRILAFLWWVGGGDVVSVSGLTAFRTKYVFGDKPLKISVGKKVRK